MNNVLIAIVAVVALACGGLIYHQLNQPEMPENALFYKQARDVDPFELTDHQGQAFTNEQLKGKWSWLFFGYTSCPDVCPTTLQELNFVYDELKAISDTQVLLVSVDPQRDTVEKLSQYIAYFNQEFVALRGDHSALYPFARNLGLMYAIADDGRHDSYLVDHSASIVLVNPKGKIAAIFKPQQALGKLPVVSGDNVVADFARVVKLTD